MSQCIFVISSPPLVYQIGQDGKIRALSGLVVALQGEMGLTSVIDVYKLREKLSTKVKITL